MGALGDLWKVLTETPDDRRKREREGRVITKSKQTAKTAPTSHPDDFYGFDGLNKYSAGKSKGKRGH